MRNLLTCFLLAVSLVSCDSRQASEYQGVLYFGQGAYLMRYSLQDGSLAVAGHLGDTVIREISSLGSEYLLIAETASVNRRQVSRISFFTLATGESVDLYAGVRARSLENPGVIVYDDGSDLIAVPRQPNADNEVIYSHDKNQLTQMVAAAPSLLLFETRDEGDLQIRSWNAVTGEIDDLEGLTATCRLDGAVWIGSLRLLACQQRSGSIDGARYVLSGLDGSVEGRLNLPADKEFLALCYIEAQQALVLQETWQGLLGDRDKHAIWIYNVQTGAGEPVAEAVNLGGSVVYALF